MSRSEMAHLELVAEIDWLTERLGSWGEKAPHWEPARTCQAVIRRLLERTDAMRVRLESPLVIATLGGTGTGKSALVNALVGADVTETGKSRPTTLRPRLICRSDITPQMLGIDPASVELVQRDLPHLADMVLIDCPDPDTTESSDVPKSNLARLRAILPHCDVLLVATTQQKYRSARVSNELASAAPGARLVFVQTHADEDEDIRSDWRASLEDRYDTGNVYFVDSIRALDDVRSGRAARGEFAELLDLLTRQLAGSAPARIRRANFLDLVADALDGCRTRIDQGLPAVTELSHALDEQRTSLAASLAEQTHEELLASRRQWENRLVGKVASRWGFSPFALVLRAFQGVGGLLSGAFLFRARTPAQVALWGAFEGARMWHRRRNERDAEETADRALAQCWDTSQLRAATLVIDGYTSEAGLDRDAASLETATLEAAEAGQTFVASVSTELERLLDRVALRHTGWWTRCRYEILLLAMLGVLLFRSGKNFFYDAWLAPEPTELLGFDFYLLAAFWMVFWSGLLLWLFTGRLRRGLRREVNRLAEAWSGPEPASGIFAQLESECLSVEHHRQELAQLRQHVARLRTQLGVPDEQLGRLRDQD